MTREHMLQCLEDAHKRLGFEFVRADYEQCLDSELMDAVDAWLPE